MRGKEEREEEGKKEEFAFVKTGTGSSRQGKKGGGAT